MRCPTCKRETLWEGNLYRPFCSERCKLLDLDNWFSERYRVASPGDSREPTAEVAENPTTTEGKRG